MIPLEQKQLYTKRDKRGKTSIPIMLVQALQYQNTACESGTGGRRTTSIAPGAVVLCGQSEGWGSVPPTASWRQDRLTHLSWRSDIVCPRNQQVLLLLWHEWLEIVAHQHGHNSHWNFAKVRFRLSSLSHQMRISESSMSHCKRLLCPLRREKCCSKSLKAEESQNQVSMIDKPFLNAFRGIWEKENMEVFSNPMWFTHNTFIELWNKMQLTV